MHEINKIETGKRIRQLREAVAETQADLAELLNVKRQIISYYESGTRIPTLEHLIFFADHYNTTTDYLLGLSEHSTTDKDLIFIADYLGIDENTCKIMHNKVFDEHTKQFIKYLFQNENLFNEMDFYFSSVVLTWLYSSLYKYLPIKPRYSFIKERHLVKKIALSSMFDVLPTARHRFLLSIKDRNDVVEQMTFEIMQKYVDLFALKREVEFYLKNPDFVPDKVLSAVNVTDNEFLLNEFDDLKSEERAIEEFREIMDFKVDFYNKLLNKKGGGINGDNP